MSRPHFVPIRTRTKSKARAKTSTQTNNQMHFFQSVKQQLLRIFNHVWISAISILVLLFAAIVGLPSLSALLFHHSEHANIEAIIHTSDASIQVKVYHTVTNQVSTMSLGDYIEGVLAAEFDKSAEPDALKAAAVACRTYVIRAKSIHQTTAQHSSQQDADVTDNPTLDLPYMSYTEMSKQYGGDTPEFIAQLQSAIQSTDGLILTFKEKPILAFTTLVSPGTTRDAADAFGTSIPYLKAIVCKDDQRAANRIHTMTLSSKNIAQALRLPQVDLTKLRISSIDKTGFVQTVMYGQTVWQGTKFAAALKFPSPKFTFAIADGKLRVTTDGIGSGLGMSLNEAKSLAANGKSWTDILGVFYPGTNRELDTDFLVE